MMMPNLPLTEKKNFVLHSPEIKQPNADGQSDHRHNLYIQEQYNRSMWDLNNPPPQQRSEHKITIATLTKE